MNFRINPVQKKNENCYYMLLEVVGTLKIRTEATTTKEKVMKQKKLEEENEMKGKITVAN